MRVKVITTVTFAPNNTAMKTYIKYGIISGIIAITLILLSYITGLQDKLTYSQAEILGFVSMIVALLVIIMAILETRRKQGGTITFGKALGTGMMVALIGGIIFGAGIAIMMEAQGEDYMIELMAKAKAGILSSDIPETEKQAQLAQMEAYSSEDSIFTNSWFNGLLMFGHVIVLGFIISLITALTLKRNAN